MVKLKRNVLKMKEIEKKVKVHIFISGRVQGVFFRDWTRRQAKKLGIFGWVKNLEDGRVEAVFEGEEEKVKKMIELAKRGPILAKVKNLEIEWQEYKSEFNNFEIKY